MSSDSLTLEKLKLKLRQEYYDSMKCRSAVKMTFAE